MAADLRVVEPLSIAEAIEARRSGPESRYLGGGTDLLANLRRGLDEPKALIDLRRIPELRTLAFEATGLRIGATVTLAELIRNDAVRAEYPALIAAAEAVAAPAHREAGTVGGNLCLSTRCAYYNESAWWRESNQFCLKYRGTKCHIAPGGKRCWAAYSGDLAPALLVYGAEVQIAGSACGTTSIPLADLFADDGAAHLTLQPDEFVAQVRLPRDPWPAAYEKTRARGAIDFPLVGAALARRGPLVRIALTGTDPRPILLELHGTVDVDEICAYAGKAISPMRTTVESPFYRRRAALALLRKLYGKVHDEHVSLPN